jgi:hypothetical protein
MINLFKSLFRKKKIIEGLRISKADYPFSCSKCNRMKPTGTNIVWVPNDIIGYGWNCKPYTTEDIKKSIRNNRFNGHFTGVCERCAPKEYV